MYIYRYVFERVGDRKETRKIENMDSSTRKAKMPEIQYAPPWNLSERYGYRERVGECPIGEVREKIAWIASFPYRFRKKIHSHSAFPRNGTLDTTKEELTFLGRLLTNLGFAIPSILPPHVRLDSVSLTRLAVPYAPSAKMESNTRPWVYRHHFDGSCTRYVWHGPFLHSCLIHL